MRLKKREKHDMEIYEICLFALLVMMIIGMAILLMLLGWMTLEKFIDWQDRKNKEEETKRMDRLFNSWATEFKI